MSFSKAMIRKIGFWLLWASFAAYAFFLAPPNQPDTASLLLDLVTGKWDGINPLVVAVFNLLGIFPMIYACLMFFDGRVQKVPAWIFSSASFGVGAFALLPYLALREPNGTFSGEKNWFLKLLDSRWTGLAIALGTIALVAYGVVGGDWSNFIQQWQSDRFVNVMSLDFCVLCLVFPALLGDDMARRRIQNKGIFWIVALIPLFGAVTYLILRPPIQTTAPSTASESSRGKGFSISSSR